MNKDDIFDLILWSHKKCAFSVSKINFIFNTIVIILLTYISCPECFKKKMALQPVNEKLTSLVSSTSSLTHDINRLMPWAVLSSLLERNIILQGCPIYKYRSRSLIEKGCMDIYKWDSLHTPIWCLTCQPSHLHYVWHASLHTPVQCLTNQPSHLYYVWHTSLHTPIVCLTCQPSHTYTMSDIQYIKFNHTHWFKYIFAQKWKHIIFKLLTWYEWVTLGPASRALDSYQVNNVLIIPLLCHNFISFLHRNGWTLKNISKCSTDYENHIIEVITFSYHAELSHSKVGNQGIFLICLLCVYECHDVTTHDIWQLHQKSVSQNKTSWQLHKKSGPQNQGTNAIIIALILLSLDPIVRSGLHNTGG